MNADLSGQAIILAVPVKQASVARAPIDQAGCRHHCVVEVPEFVTIAATRNEHLVSLLREAQHAAVTALPAFIQHSPSHHVPALTPTLPTDIILTIN
ncbi:hypothetical protein CSQ91_10020 [Janthinobacterium sp. BJB301]|uniref:hypothetical protein n=1 Tax=Janthinobacterium sp. BJB301 TaxID=1560195 RepID=UPI000C0FF93C|nr:hypothetical protein [Janthinobacterium sp. BJB301]PHV51410.1 hypothetical protein CSQ91_10020 [Janthinobacterium sp. BJB301]